MSVISENESSRISNFKNECCKWMFIVQQNVKYFFIFLFASLRSLPSLHQIIESKAASICRCIIHRISSANVCFHCSMTFYFLLVYVFNIFVLLVFHFVLFTIGSYSTSAKVFRSLNQSQLSVHSSKHTSIRYKNALLLPLEKSENITFQQKLLKISV